MSALIRRNRIFAHSSSWICRERLGDPDPKSKLPSSPHPCPTSSSKLKLRAELRRTVVQMQATHLKFRRKQIGQKRMAPTSHSRGRSWSRLAHAVAKVLRGEVDARVVSEWANAYVIRVRTKKEGLAIIEAEVCVFRPCGGRSSPGLWCPTHQHPTAFRFFVK